MQAFGKYQFRQALRSADCHVYKFNSPAVFTDPLQLLQRMVPICRNGGKGDGRPAPWRVLNLGTHG